MAGAADRGGAEQPPAAAAARRLVRPRYHPERALRYQLKLSGQTRWTPPLPRFHWGKMATTLVFELRPKALREDGGCTLQVHGERLESEGEGPDGDFAIIATPDEVKLQDGRGRRLTLDQSPLKGPTTLTLGPRLEFQFGTGLLPLAPFMLPHVDQRFWHLLTIAPEQPVGAGDTWAQQFDLAVPGGQGTPLHVAAGWKVTGWRRYRGLDVLVLELAAELELKDSDLLLLDGDRVHVARGRYRASGQALWDMEHGLLCAATARQQLAVVVDRPAQRVLSSHSVSSLELLAAAGETGSSPPVHP